MAMGEIHIIKYIQCYFPGERIAPSPVLCVPTDMNVFLLRSKNCEVSCDKSAMT